MQGLEEPEICIEDIYNPTIAIEKETDISVATDNEMEEPQSFVFVHSNSMSTVRRGGSRHYGSLRERPNKETLSDSKQMRALRNRNDIRPGNWQGLRPVVNPADPKGPKINPLGSVWQSFIDAGTHTFGEWGGLIGLPFPFK
jgi:hypothetical protein